MPHWKNLFLAAALLAAVSSRAEPPSTNAAPETPRTFEARGVVKSLDSDGKTVVIQHEAVPGYMAAMTMPFVDRNPAELTGLQPGDSVAFRINVTSKEGWIDHVTKTGTVQIIRTEAGSEHPIVQVVRDVPPLGVGDELPDYHFTNELGEKVSLGQFRGQALAFTFFHALSVSQFLPLCVERFGGCAEKTGGHDQCPGQLAPALDFL